MTKNQLIKYLKETELDIQNANSSLFLADFVFTFYADSHKVHGINFSPVCSYFSYTKLSAFYQIICKKFIVDINEKVYNDFKKDKKSFDEKINKHQELTRELDDIWNDYQAAKKKGLNKIILNKFYNKFEKVSRIWWYYGTIGEDKGSIIDREIIPSFAKRKNISINKARELISVLSHPKERAVFNLERREFLDICLLVSREKFEKLIKNNQIDIVLKNKKLIKLINHYLENYFWIKTDFCKARKITTESILSDVIKELDRKTKKEIEKELVNIDKGFQEIENKKNKLIKKYKLSPEDKNEIYFSSRTIYWVDQRKFGMMKNLYYLLNIMADVADFYDIKFEDLTLYSLNDFKNLLATEEKVDKKTLKNRYESAFMVCESGKKTEFFYGATGRKMFEISTHVDKKELKGVVASKGKGGVIIGRVKIVLNPAKTDFKDDEILVTSMTRVEFISLMRRAKAIITNEGGLACHAAIISRELGIPAIISTRNATQVLKDGDMVNLDLKTGVINVLKE